MKKLCLYFIFRLELTPTRNSKNGIYLQKFSLRIHILKKTTRLKKFSKIMGTEILFKINFHVKNVVFSLRFQFKNCYKIKISVIYVCMNIQYTINIVNINVF